MNTRRLCSALVLVAGCASRPPAAPEAPAFVPESRYAIVPAPARLDPRPGELRMDAAATIRADDGALNVATLLADALHHTTGLNIPVLPGASPGTDAGGIVLRITGTPADSADESYTLDVRPARALLTARSAAGLFRGTQTLLQLVPPHAGGGVISIPAVRIEDAPRFRYRGMHLDVARHFFPPDFIRRYIDLLAYYRFNTFHWHLTEDQGWRIEIRRHPRLTEVGAWRRETMVERNFDPYIGDGTPYGGYYTQDEIRDIVAYAAARHITIVPEIEMPGHSLAALAAYPELACTPGPFEVATRWGVFEDILCPHEHTFEFLEDVLTEVMELFPSRYIHIGGDEAPKRRWRESEAAQAVIRREGLADEDELQSWFIRRIERFLNGHGRRLIGWDEILEGGLAPDATVMSWRGTQGGVEAARQGHDVVMTPTSHLYFDYYQGPAAQEPLAIGGFVPLEQVYAFEPVPQELNEAERRHILGAQGNVWTEYMKTPEHVEYMVLPRLLALAEVVWSPAERRDWSDFMTRLPAQLRRLDRAGLNYRVPDVQGLDIDGLTLADGIVLRLYVPVADARIHYTLDGSEPTPSSPAVPDVLRLPVDEAGVTVSARAFLPDGRSGAIATGTYRRTTLRDPDPAPADRAPGLRVDYFEGDFRTTQALDGAAVVRSDIIAGVRFGGFERDERFGLRFTGWIDVPADGIYRFHLTSDDGAVLRIGGGTVVDHGGLHGPSERSGGIALRRGAHAFELRYFQAGGGRTLRLEVTPPDGTRGVAGGFTHDQFSRRTRTP